MEVIKDVKKLINQALGKENMFGFKTTLANQMYLLFCLIGNVYFTEKIHRKTKLVWFCCANGVLLFVGFSFIFCLIFAKPMEDILLLVYMVYEVTYTSMEVIVKPAIAIFWYRDEIEQMISMADKILLKQQLTKGSYENDLDVNKIMKYSSVVLVMSILLYNTITLTDLILFYEEEKVKNYMYYVTPLPGLTKFGSMTLYMAYTVLFSSFSFGGFILIILHRVFAIPWAVICHNETQRIIKELNSVSEDVDINIDTFKRIEPKFRYVMRKCIRDINDLNRFVTSFRGFFETIASFVLPITLYVSVTHVLMAISPGLSFVIRMRELFPFFYSIIEVYLICWVGATLKQTVSDLSFAVYSTPWYWLKSIRKDVYILLCQTQAEINLRALSVYPLTLSTFLRFCNVINSTVNVFRAYTN
ncbi:uncharacterized protein LOC135850024 [Planococcus citri]|uniref:uncharacterized protein LOC135850024 n=1 Tax=Planococcus citri TaxID=170843 RepID=UPI0031F93889